MRVRDFELQVAGGREEAGSATVFLAHGQVYQLVFTNHLKRQRCDARVTIDGKEIGTFRVPPEKAITVERSVHQDGKFTFFRLGSPEAVATKVPLDGKAGKVTVQFIPEALIRNKLFSDEIATLGAAKPESIDEDAGGTGLTGKSDQQFKDADDIYTYDPSASVRIELRMRCEADLTSNDSKPTPASRQLQDQINALRQEVEAAEAGEDYLAPEHLRKIRLLACLEMDIRLVKRDEAQAIRASQMDGYAEYEVLSGVVLTCPDCHKDSKVPKGIGHVRVRCPHCDCQFVRKV